MSIFRDARYTKVGGGLYQFPRDLECFLHGLIIVSTVFSAAKYIEWQMDVRVIVFTSTYFNPIFPTPSSSC